MIINNIITLRVSTTGSFDDESDVRRFFLTSGSPILIGRSSRFLESREAKNTNALFPYTVLSKTHALLHIPLYHREADGTAVVDESDGYFVEDLGSKNGTMLNGQVLEPHKKYPLVPDKDGFVILGFGIPSKLHSSQKSNNSITVGDDGKAKGVGFPKAKLIMKVFFPALKKLGTTVASDKVDVTKISYITNSDDVYVVGPQKKTIIEKGEIKFGEEMNKFTEDMNKFGEDMNKFGGDVNKFKEDMDHHSRVMDDMMKKVEPVIINLSDDDNDDNDSGDDFHDDELFDCGFSDDDVDDSEDDAADDDDDDDDEDNDEEVSDDCTFNHELAGCLFNFSSVQPKPFPLPCFKDIVSKNFNEYLENKVRCPDIIHNINVGDLGSKDVQKNDNENESSSDKDHIDSDSSSDVSEYRSHNSRSTTVNANESETTLEEVSVTHNESYIRDDDKRSNMAQVLVNESSEKENMCTPNAVEISHSQLDEPSALYNIIKKRENSPSDEDNDNDNDETVIDRIDIKMYEPTSQTHDQATSIKDDVKNKLYHGNITTVDEFLFSSSFASRELSSADFPTNPPSEIWCGEELKPEDESHYNITLGTKRKYDELHSEDNAGSIKKNEEKKDERQPHKKTKRDIFKRIGKQIVTHSVAAIFGGVGTIALLAKLNENDML